MSPNYTPGRSVYVGPVQSFPAALVGEHHHLLKKKEDHGADNE